MGICRGLKLTLMALAAAVLVASLGGGVAMAETATPLWTVRSVFAPAHIAPGGSGELIVVATNLGDAPIVTSATIPVKVGAAFPAGVSVTAVADDQETTFDGHIEKPEWSCELAAVSCESSSGDGEEGYGFVYPYETTEMVIHFTLPANPQPELKVRMFVSGGGGNPASSEVAIPVGEAPVQFGIERFEQTPLNADGSTDTQAGSHPFQFVTTLAYNMGLTEQDDAGVSGTPELAPEPLAMPKELAFDLPPGLVGNPTVMPQCPLDKFDPSNNEESECPADTAVGVVANTLSFYETGFTRYSQPDVFLSPVFNLVPAPGEPARFGFVIRGFGANVPIYLDTSVRVGRNYGVVVSVHNIRQDLWFVGSQLSFWGVPADPRHNIARGRCEFGHGGSACLPTTTSAKLPPFLTLPGSCSGLSDPLTSSVEASSWEQPGASSTAQSLLGESAGVTFGLDGCNRLGFEPSIKVSPDGQAASTPTGLTVDVHQSQQRALNETGLAPADVRNITVTLPAGVQLNPAGADGLQSCSEEQIGYEPEQSTPEALAFSSGEASCPDASKIGTVTIRTPLLPNALEGAVYLAAQGANPFRSLVAMYVVASDPVSGVLVKLAGEVSLNQETGQITTTLTNSPQLPFEDAELHFFGGDRAPLATPAHCGPYTTDAAFTPWSGNEAVESQSLFELTGGPNGASCPGALPFAPLLTGGATSIQAAGFTPFTTTISREDGDQNIQTVQLHLPAGVSGALTGVKLCGEAQANAGTCGPESLIGHTIVSVGLGGNPFSVTGGEVFLTERYDGAPFGLSIVNPAVAGPFNLGKVVVRATVAVDPHTAALTITTGAIPHILDGIPLQIRRINVTIDRPNFTFNPTNCEPQAITGSVSSVEGASSPVSVPFQVTNCATLKFAPKFAVSTSGHTSRADGASLHVKLTYPTGALYANIHSVKVELPKQLPSRLSTLQKACTAQQFETNPAGCPPASVVGHATATTPILPVPLEGPAYFVSHGGEAFPSLIVVLQGYGVTVDLVGTTFISHSGITSSTFKEVPDVPVGSFELTLPEGPYSALAANGNLCKARLAMPTSFVAQNGQTQHQATKITIAGCPKARKARSHRGASKKAHHAGARGHPKKKH